jgi:hypothetical protein
MSKIKEYLELQSRIHSESDIKAFMKKHGIEIPIAFGTKDRLEFTRARIAIAKHLLSQQWNLHYAEVHYNDHDSGFIGVFTSLELAQAACAEHAGETIDEELTWEPRGDLVRAICSYEYTIMCIPIDQRESRE